MGSIKGLVDVSKKPVTERIAVAEGKVILGQEIFKVLKHRKAPKGDVLDAARFAALMAVKETSRIIPHCHSIPVDSIAVDFVLDETRYILCVKVMVKAFSKTGVEMEALTGVGVACLTVYDMLKFKGRDMTITGIRLLKKTGGKSGTYVRKD